MTDGHFIRWYIYIYIQCRQRRQQVNFFFVFLTQPPELSGTVSKECNKRVVTKVICSVRNPKSCPPVRSKSLERRTARVTYVLRVIFYFIIFISFLLGLNSPDGYVPGTPCWWVGVEKGARWDPAKYTFFLCFFRDKGFPTRTSYTMSLYGIRSFAW